MNKTIRTGAAGIAMFAAMGMGSVAHAETATATATAEVLEALDFELTSGSLDFGAIVVDDSGTVVLAPAGGRTCSANLTCAGTSDTPLFTVEGTEDKSVTITLPTSAVTLLVAGGTPGESQDELTVDNFSSDATGSAVTLTGGQATFRVGGTLNVSSVQTAGVYTGSFDVTVEYS